MGDQHPPCPEKDKSHARRPHARASFQPSHNLCFICLHRANLVIVQAHMMTFSIVGTKFAHKAWNCHTSSGSKPLNSVLLCDLPLIIPHDLVQLFLQHQERCCTELTRFSRRICCGSHCTGNLMHRTLPDQPIKLLNELNHLRTEINTIVK